MIIEVCTGLMSRCNTLFDAYLIAKHAGLKEITVVWPLEWGVGVHFYDVFSRDAFPEMKINLVEYLGHHDFGDHVLEDKYSTVDCCGIKKALKTGRLNIIAILLAGRFLAFLKKIPVAVKNIPALIHAGGCKRRLNSIKAKYVGESRYFEYVCWWTCRENCRRSS